MKTSVLVGVCAVVLLSAAAAPAQHQDKSSSLAANKGTLKPIACAQKRGAPLGECSYRVKRDETGKTTVTVIFANGFKRGLFFKDGAFVKASVTMSGVGTDTDWSLKDGTHFIRVDGQRYEVPDTLIADH